MFETNIEIISITLFIVLIITSAISKSIQDTLQFYFDKSVFDKKNQKWWNSKISWENKWKLENNILIKNDKRLWYYLFLYKPKYKESFPYSSTFLVALTDGWHFFGLLRDFSLFSCIPIMSQNYWLFFGYPIYRLIFHIFFTTIFTKKS